MIFPYFNSHGIPRILRSTGNFDNIFLNIKWEKEAPTGFRERTLAVSSRMLEAIE